MTRNNSGILRLVIAGFILMINSCTKNDTKFYPDQEDEGLGIFSNTNNNLMSCYINGRAWRTRDRTSGLFIGRALYEIDITKQSSIGLRDTLLIAWLGYYSNDRQTTGNLNLLLSIPHNSGYRYLSGLQGQRLIVDSSNGYFVAPNNITGSPSIKGTGSIYFHTCQFDSLAPNLYQAKMAGLFDADFKTFKITRGRFDHDITSQQISLH